jgi:hypothetical protein
MKNRGYSAHFAKLIRKFSKSVFALSILSALLASARGQVVSTGNRRQMASMSRTLPSLVQKQVQALGTRMRIAGKEETVLDAQFADDVGRKKTIHIVHEISGMLRIEGMHEKSAVSFDGKFTHGVEDRTDSAMMDTFILDTTEGMFDALQRGASLVLLGHDFQPHTGAVSESMEPRYDIFLVTAPQRIRPDDVPQPRRYYFSSATGLLASTRYVEVAGRNIETRFLNWLYIDGSAYPTTIERYENGRLTFSITTTAVAGQSPRNTEAFQTGVNHRD